MAFARCLQQRYEACEAGVACTLARVPPPGPTVSKHACWHSTASRSMQTVRPGRRCVEQLLLTHQFKGHSQHKAFRSASPLPSAASTGLLPTNIQAADCAPIIL